MTYMRSQRTVIARWSGGSLFNNSSEFASPRIFALSAVSFSFSTRSTCARSLNAAKLGWGAGKYSVKGALPKVPSHVRLHVGWFNETLPPFLDGLGRGPVAFAHLDADIYTSTISVLDALAARCRLRLGTVLSFDREAGRYLMESVLLPWGKCPDLMLRYA